MHERELKLAVAPTFRLPDLADVAEGVYAAPGVVQRIRTTYWDADDLRLARWRCTLRCRTGEGWTVKLPGKVDRGILIRPELTFEGAPSRPPRPALDLLTAFLRGSRVSPAARLRTRRELVELSSEDRVAVAVTLDDVTIVDGTRASGRFREVEVEMTGESGEAVLEAVRGRLIASGAEQAEAMPKHVHALGNDALVPPDVEVETPGRHATVAQVIRWALASSVHRLILHDPFVRLGDDPEAVHQCRVATRRLRSDLATFSDHLDAERSAGLREELRWLAEVLGSVRDADVLLALLSQSGQDLPTPSDRKAAAAPLVPLSDRREGGRTRLLETLRSTRYVTLLNEAVGAAVDPGFSSASGAPGTEILGPMVRRSWRRLRRAVADLEDPPTDQALHAVRIQAKRCRYAAEAANPVLGKPAARLARRVARVQEVLGDHQDAVVAEGWLRKSAAKTRGRAAFGAGLLAGRMTLRQAAARERFPAAWRRAVTAADKVTW